jgi:hypothetical protein
MNVALRPEASSDLVSAAAYFNDISDGWGDHFLNTIRVGIAWGLSPVSCQLS